MMSNVSGQIEYTGFVLYLSVPMVELRESPTPLHQMLTQNLAHAVGITTDLNEDGAEEFLDLVVESPEEFMEHFTSQVPAGLAAVGILVWEGGATINAQQEVTFSGTVRRPSPEDLATYATIIEREDEEAKAGMEEHAKHCRHCAAKLGLDPSTVTDDEEGMPPRRHAVWFVRNVGEA